MNRNCRFPFLGKGVGGIKIFFSGAGKSPASKSLRGAHGNDGHPGFVAGDFFGKEPWVRREKAAAAVDGLFGGDEPAADVFVVGVMARVSVDRVEDVLGRPVIQIPSLSSTRRPPGVVKQG